MIRFLICLVLLYCPAPLQCFLTAAFFSLCLFFRTCFSFNNTTITIFSLKKVISMHRKTEHKRERES